MTMDSRQPEAERLRQDVEWALRRALDPTDVLPMLHRLARTATEGTEESVFAHRNLAELLVERDPWRAALHARKVLAHRDGDDRGWAMLGLCQTLLGHYRYAVAAYERALSRAPKNPWYAHNLGHLLDVALGKADQALPWLKSAYGSAASAGNAEIAASYAHALARAGELGEAKKVVTRAMKKSSSREHAALLRWLEDGAPAGRDQPSPRPSPMPRRLGREEDSNAGDVSDATPARSRRSTASKGATAELERILTRGVASLPLDARQRARAKELARDALGLFAARNDAPRAKLKLAPTLQSLAAAIAYAIVYVDHVPLTQAEVAACFRVSVASLRGRFGDLRSQLDLTPGDARYATVRRR
jgi:tetratricopeptide (TPR) repeat protein